MSSRPRLPFGVIGFGAVAGVATLFLALGAPRDRSVPRVAPTTDAPAVAAGGVTLTAVSADLPSDDAALPDRPGVAAVATNCTGCHSPAMILSQPPLKREQWQAEVEKMQKAYHAPVEPAAVPAIVDYLEGLSPLSFRGEERDVPQARR